MLYSIKPVNFYIREENQNETLLQMDKILKRLFTLKNKRPIIDFLNATYNDNLSYDSEINYSNTELINTRKLTARYVTFNADLYITAVDGNDIFEYAIEFQTIFDKEIAIRIFRYGFERALNLDYYRDKNHIILKFPEPYLILIEEEPDINDTVTLEIQVPKSESFHFKINILKYWTYDLGKLYEENKYLLYPLQIFKLRKEMEAIRRSTKSESVKEQLMIKLYVKLKEVIFDSVNAIDKAYKDGKIGLTDYDEMTIVIENLNSYLLNIYGNYGTIEQEVKEMVKSFYDPTVEARGIEKGIEKGIQKGIEKGIEQGIEQGIEKATKTIAENMIKDGDTDEKIKRCTGLNEEDINKLRKLLETQGEH